MEEYFRPDRKNNIRTAREIGKELISYLENKYSHKAKDYHEYINSKEWKNKSATIKLDRGYRCQLCHVSGYAKTLHVHHNTYERIGIEDENDLVVLCCDCHKLFHDNNSPQANKIELSKQEILKILHFNGINKNNDNVWDWYTEGKRIINHIIDGYNENLYDKYNNVNIDIVEGSIDRQNKTIKRGE